MQHTLGQSLKAAREARGLTLADAAHETRIPAQRLQNLERDDLASFGSMTYARSFLKLYSDFLGVDAGEVLSDLPSAVLGGRQNYRYLTDSYGPWLRDGRPPSVRTTEPVASSSRVQTIKSPVPAGIALFLFLVALAGLYGQYVATRGQQESPAPQVQTVVNEAVADKEMPQPAAAVTTEEQPVQVQPAIPVDPLVIAPQSKSGLIELNPREGL